MTIIETIELKIAQCIQLQNKEDTASPDFQYYKGCIAAYNHVLSLLGIQK